MENNSRLGQHPHPGATIWCLLRSRGLLSVLNPRGAHKFPLIRCPTTLVAVAFSAAVRAYGADSLLHQHGCPSAWVGGA